MRWASTLTLIAAACASTAFAAGLEYGGVAGETPRAADGARPPTARTAAAPSAARPGRAAQAPAPVAVAATGMADFGPAEIGPAMQLAVGKSTLLRLPGSLDRISVGNPAIADVTLISNRELYLLGKEFGTTNVILWRNNGPTTVIDVTVSADASGLQQRLQELMPEEKGIAVGTAADAVVLSGTISSALAANYAVSIAEAFARNNLRGFTLPITAGNAPVAAGQQIQVGQSNARATGGGTGPQGALRVINMMSVAAPQQVMLEVRVAEISKNLLDQLGIGFDSARVSGGTRFGIISNFLNSAAGVLSLTRQNGNSLTLDAERRDGLVKILAEPNIMAISGQEASFLAGGRIFIPVARSDRATGIPAITLEEKEFGVGLRFTPTVLAGGRIHLRVAPEVSELAQTGSPFTTLGGVTAVLPSFTTRRAATSVQLMDGQSLAIAGLIRNNVTETIRRFPLLGDVPILGALFRSSEFQTDRSELMFIVTPRLVKPMGEGYALPTDNFVPPNRAEFFGNGQLEGSGHPDVPPDRGPGTLPMLPGAPPVLPAPGAAGPGAPIPAAPMSGAPMPAASMPADGGDPQLSAAQGGAALSPGMPPSQPAPAGGFEIR